MHHRFTQQVSSSICLGPEDIKGHRPVELVTLHKPQGPCPHSQPHFTKHKVWDHQGRCAWGGRYALHRRLEELVLEILLSAGTNTRCGGGGCGHGTRSCFFARCCPPCSCILLLCLPTHASLPSSWFSLIPCHLPVGRCLIGCLWPRWGNRAPFCA